MNVDESHDAAVAVAFDLAAQAPLKTILPRCCRSCFDVPAYKASRVIRIKVSDLDAFIDACKVEPGTLGHLYPPRDLDEVG